MLSNVVLRSQTVFSSLLGREEKGSGEHSTSSSLTHLGITLEGFRLHNFCNVNLTSLAS